MATILFTHEFGSGLGHLSQMIPLAQRLAPFHRLIFAVPEPQLAEPLIRQSLGQSVELHQTYVWSAVQTRLNERSHTLAGPLYWFGFDENDKLEPATKKWLDLIEAVQPKVIVADAAPGLSVAARGRVPIVVMGTGYTVPPDGRMLPRALPSDIAVPQTSGKIELDMLQAVNRQRAKLQLPVVAYFADLFSGDKTFVFTLPECDPYREYRTVETLIPYTGQVPGPVPSKRAGPDIFLYLPHVHPATRTMLDLLNSLNIRSEVFIFGTDPRAISGLCRRNVLVHTKPADLISILPQCMTIIHHGGLGMVCASIAAGTPQLILPMNTETSSNADAAQKIAAAECLTMPPIPDAAAMKEALNRLRSESSFENALGAAARFAETLQSQDGLGQVFRAVSDLAR